MAFSYIKSRFIGSYDVVPAMGMGGVQYVAYRNASSLDVVPAMGMGGVQYVAYRNASSLRKWMEFCERNWPSLLLGAATLNCGFLGTRLPVHFCFFRGALVHVLNP
ncbi:hypothetical protein FCV25MIE_11761 [Fagus crenata]